MNFEYFLYQYLLKHHKAEVTGFGVFQLTKESAKIDAENYIITPPKEVVVFHYQTDLVGGDLENYISNETNSDLSTVTNNVKNEVEKWLRKLQTGNTLVLENIGQFQLDDHHQVIKLPDSNDDVFGLEAINLQALKKKSAKKYADPENYAFNKNVIWVFITIIILGVGSLFLFGDQDLILGKPSQIPVKKLTPKRIPEKAAIIPRQDSTKQDSIKPIKNAHIQKINR